MKTSFFVFCVLVLCVCAMTPREDREWLAFKKRFHRVFSSPSEEFVRHGLFRKSVESANLLSKSDKTARYGPTMFSDRFPHEIPHMSRTSPLSEISGNVKFESSVSDLPASYDARTEGVIPTIKNQAMGVTSSIFCAVTSLTSGYAKKNKPSKLPVLSTQMFIDCVPKSGSANPTAWDDLTFAKKGVMLDSDYPYTARVGTCKFNQAKSKFKCTGPSLLKGVDNMKKAIYEHGSIVARMNSMKLNAYHGGIISATSCPTTVNIEVNIVGWGKSGNMEYWITNPWFGSSWGENGYCRIVTGNNACGIESYPYTTNIA